MVTSSSGSSGSSGSIRPLEQRVLDLIGVEEVASLAAALVVAPGENPPGQEAATVEVLRQAARLRGLGWAESTVVPGRDNVMATVTGGDGPGLLLLGHSDVVPVGAGWTTDPFGGLVRDGRLWGRGAADMKGGLAACLVAMGALQRAGAELSGPVDLAVTVDEEDLGTGIRHYLGDFDAEAYRGCVVAEPTELQTIIAARGDCYLEIRVHGRSAHSGNPADGRNAVYGATMIIEAIRRRHEELARHGHPLTGPATWSVGQIHGGTATSIVPAQCVLAADRRLLPGESGADAVAETRALIDGVDLASEQLSADVTLVMEMPGFDTPSGCAFVQLVDHAASAAGRGRRELGGWSAACDGGFLAEGTELPVIVLGPGSVADQAHRADESVPLTQLLTAARSYALLALRLLADPCVETV